MFIRGRGVAMEKNCGKGQKNMEQGPANQEQLRTKVIKALSADYESICSIDLDCDQIVFYCLSDRTSAISDQCFQICKFSWYISEYADIWVCPEDLEMFKKAVLPESIRENLRKDQPYYIHYRVLVNKELQNLQLNFVNVGSQDHISQVVLGCRRVDDEIRQQTEQKRLLEDALEKANLAIAAKNTFLSNISHDMRTPLNAIFGFTSLAKLKLHDLDAVQGYLEQVETASRQLLDMITEVLEISALSSAAGPAEVECDLEEIVGEVYDFLLPQAQEKNLVFTMDCSGLRHRGVYANQENLRQLVLNLVNNAVTYTEPGGRVTLSFKEEDELPNHYSVYSLVVEDTGIGISEDFLERIFDPFSREKNSTLSGIHSIGLGLTIAKDIVDKMGGTIDVKSQVGEGSTFTASLCFRVQPVSSQTDKERDMAASRQLSQRILLVEDNEINLEIETELLENMGFIIDPAENGKIALEKIEGAAPGDYDLIIMDIQMPVMDGWQTSAAIRKLSDPVLSHIPIIALSANALASDIQKSKENGINVHLSKPMNLPVLLETIEEITGKHCFSDNN